MKSTHPLAIIVLLSVSLLSGCISGDDEPQTDDPEEIPSQGLGTVTGSIFTVNLDAVENARIQLVQDGEGVDEAMTDKNGAYTIRNVEPGDYRMQISAACCPEQVRPVTVVADDVVNEDVQLEVYSSDDLQEPRVERLDWTGFLACTLRFTNPEGPHHDVNVLGVPGGVSGVNACGVVEIGAENATGDDFLKVWEASPGLKSVVGALSWDAPGAALGDQLSITMEVGGRPNLEPRYVNEEGYSPVEFRADAGDVVAEFDEEDDEGHDIHQYDFDNLESDVELMFRIFAGGDLNVVYQQQFTVYWDLYYWEEAPEGASALPDL